MSTDVADAPATRLATALEVRVTWDPLGGWRVDALLDGHVVATRHCDDWHRVERARGALATALQRTADTAMAKGR